MTFGPPQIHFYFTSSCLMDQHWLLMYQISIVSIMWFIIIIYFITSKQRICLYLFILLIKGFISTFKHSAKFIILVIIFPFNLLFNFVLIELLITTASDHDILRNLICYIYQLLFKIIIYYFKLDANSVADLVVIFSATICRWVVVIEFP